MAAKGAAAFHVVHNANKIPRDICSCGNRIVPGPGSKHLVNAGIYAGVQSLFNTTAIKQLLVIVF